ncbi:hypothetical protein DFH06DRAFT_1344797 [Mycena polygramma]|nr:hypothetical protein DFH06DRAFT_1344797 [Mycena polygramma]
MARGRPPLDAETKATRRKVTLHRYAAKYGWTVYGFLSTPRTQECGEIVSGCSKSDEIPLPPDIEKETGTQFGTEIECVGQRRTFALTVPMLWTKDKSAAAARRHNNGTRAVYRPRLHRLPAGGSKRCRALRQCGFEEDNGEHSDADLPPGICGCYLTECQRSHKNETQDRRDWKTFHVRYAKELQGTV